MIPTTSLGSARHTDLWRCEQCGTTRPSIWRNAAGRLYHRKSRYCSGACRGASMRGKANPAYTLGNRVQQRQGRTRTGMCVWQVKEIERWMRLRDRTARQLADMIGVSRMAVHKRARSIAARQQINSLQATSKPVIILSRQATGE